MAPTPVHPRSAYTPQDTAVVDIGGSGERLLTIRIPENATSDPSEEVREILSWDKDGDGTIDVHEVRQASQALIKARKKAAVWKRSFIVLSVAATVAVAVLFGVTLATNEISKETKTDSSGTSTTTAALTTTNGARVTTDPALVAAPTLFELHTATSDTLDSLGHIPLPLSGSSDGFSDTFSGRIASHYRIAAPLNPATLTSEGHTLVAQFEGGARVTVAEDAATLTLPLGRVVQYVKGPVDPETGAASVLILGADEAANPPAVVARHAVTGARVLVRRDTSSTASSTTSSASSTTSSTSSLATLQSTDSQAGGSGSAQVGGRGRGKMRRQANWASLPPLPDHPSVSPRICRTIERQYGAVDDACKNAVGAFETATADCHEEFPGLNVHDHGAWGLDSCIRAGSVAVCRSEVCPGAEDREGCEAHCGEVSPSVLRGNIVMNHDEEGAHPIKTTPAFRPTPMSSGAISYGVGGMRNRKGVSVSGYGSQSGGTGTKRFGKRKRNRGWWRRMGRKKWKGGSSRRIGGADDDCLFYTTDPDGNPVCGNRRVACSTMGFSTIAQCENCVLSQAALLQTSNDEVHRNMAECASGLRKSGVVRDAAQAAADSSRRIARTARRLRSDAKAGRGISSRPALATTRSASSRTLSGGGPNLHTSQLPVFGHTLVCPGYDFTTSCPDAEVTASGIPVWTAVRCGAPPSDLSEACKPVTIDADGNVSVPDIIVPDSAGSSSRSGAGESTRSAAIKGTYACGSIFDPPTLCSDDDGNIADPPVYKSDITSLDLARDHLINPSDGGGVFTMFDWDLCVSHCPVARVIDAAADPPVVSYDTTCVDQCTSAVSVDAQDCLIECDTFSCFKNCFRPACENTCGDRGCSCDEYATSPSD